MMGQPEQRSRERSSSASNNVVAPAMGSKSNNDPSFVNYKYDDQSADRSHEANKGHLLGTHQSNGPLLNRGDEFGDKRRLGQDMRGSPELGHKSFQNIQHHQNLNESGSASAIDPDAMFRGNLAPSNYYNKNRNSKTMTQRHSNIEKIRKTSRHS